MGSAEGLRVERQDGLVVLRLDRPSRRNAVDVATAAELASFFEGATTDKTIRAILITGVDGIFCTGADAVRPGSESAFDRSPLDYRYATDTLGRMFHALWEVEKPVVSAVNGTVAGAGWMLALLADVVVADREARWTHVFARRGMVPHAGDSYYLPRIIPFHRLNEIALLSDTVTTETLSAWGVVNRSVATEDVLPTGLEIAHRLAAGPTRSLGLTKRLYRQSLSRDPATAFEAERNAIALISTTQDRREGVRSYVEKRKPAFIGD